MTIQHIIFQGILLLSSICLSIRELWCTLTRPCQENSSWSWIHVYISEKII